MPIVSQINSNLVQTDRKPLGFHRCQNFSCFNYLLKSRGKKPSLSSQESITLFELLRTNFIYFYLLALPFSASSTNHFRLTMAKYGVLKKQSNTDGSTSIIINTGPSIASSNYRLIFDNHDHYDHAIKLMTRYLLKDHLFRPFNVVFDVILLYFLFKCAFLHTNLKIILMRSTSSLSTIQWWLLQNQNF